VSTDPDLLVVGGDLSVVGRSFRHRDFLEKVQGTLAYAGDWQLPGMLHGQIVRSQVASARISSVDTSAAAALPGVRAVLCAKDVPCNEIADEASGLTLGAVPVPVLAADRVRYQGEPVVVVAADTPAVSAEAAELVAIEYEDLQGVFDPEAALAPDAPAVHPQGNRLVDWRFERGDVETALRVADVIVEETYRTQAVDHAYLEPEAGVGWIEGDVLTLRVATQVIEHREQIARILNLPANRVRIAGTYMGGGFGGKEDMTVEPYLALLVWATRRPVRMVWTRQESLLARPKRHPFTMRYRTAASGDGRILAQDVEILGDAGAYPLLSPRVLFAAGVTACGPYDVPNVRVRSTAAFTNNVPASAFRGFGAMQVTLGYEGQMDRLARALGLSPVEVRLRNFIEQGDPLPTHEQFETGVTVAETLRTALDALGQERARPRPGSKIGRGFACNMQPYGRSRFFTDRALCWVSLEHDGSAVVRTGATDLGGGQAASLAQIAAEVLGTTPGNVTVYIADSALTPPAGGTYATRQLYMSGNAVLAAASELRDRLAPVAAELLDASEGQLRFADGRVTVSSENGRFLSLAELVEAAERQGVLCHHLGTFHAEGGDFDPSTGRGATFPDYTFGTHAAEVEVDVETGLVRVIRYVACHDVGRAISPPRVEGQIQGGAVQGIGYALSEDVITENGTNMSALFADYLIPASADVPDIEAMYLEIAPGKGPFGARGIGEPAIGPPAAALASAIADALDVHLTELPFSPERVLRALRESTPL
jgi:CO/xanthine dehydrogenase Mo-binding subunit